MTLTVEPAAIGVVLVVVSALLWIAYALGYGRGRVAGWQQAFDTWVSALEHWRASHSLHNVPRGTPGRETPPVPL